MTAPLLSIIGILLAAASTTMVVNQGGDALDQGLSKAQAASAVILVTQIAQTVQLYDIQEGTAYEGPSLDGLVETQYLRSIPANPTGSGSPRLSEMDGRRVVSMPVPAGGAVSCESVTRMLDRIPAARAGHAGCIEEDGGPAVYAAI